MWASVRSWIDSYHVGGQSPDAQLGSDDIAWLRVLPIVALHGIALAGVFIFDLTWADALVALVLYGVRMFAITGFYHRYFAHKTFKTHRWHQFLWAAIGTSATQRGPLWWAAHHRQHHRYTDSEADPHDSRRGFWWSHLGWVLSRRHFATRHGQIRDFAAYPELVWLDRFDVFMPALLAAVVYALGSLLAHLVPQWGTHGLQLLFWGYVVSTLVLLHVTLCINSLAHRWGSRPFATPDNSRNSWVLALLTLGEGWHNNHHRYCGSARQGFTWWEVDASYYVLKLMAALGLVWDLRGVPADVLQERRMGAGT